MMPVAYSYIRFSTPEQRLGDSERRQLQSAETWAKTSGYTLDSQMRDLGRSAFRGSNATKGALSVFLAQVVSGAIPPGSAIIVEDLDRLSRQEPMNTVDIVKQIVSRGVTIYVLNDNLRLTSATISDLSTWLHFALKISLSHEESAKKSLRIKAAYSSRRKQAEDTGRPVMQRPPGWLRLREGGDGWDVVEERAEVIRRIFKMKASGMGYTSIASLLNQEGVPQTSGATFWRAGYVKRLVKNRSLLGEVTLTEYIHSRGSVSRVPRNVIPDYYPRIVSDEDFNRVNYARVVLHRRAVSGTGNMLAGLCFCGLCGSPMEVYGTRKKEDGSYFRYYVCSRGRLKSGCGRSEGWNRDSLHDSMLTMLDQFVGFGSTGTDGVRAAALSGRASNLRARIAQLQEIMEAAPSLATGQTLAKLEAQAAAAESEALEGVAVSTTAETSGIRSWSTLRAALSGGQFADVNAFLRGRIARLELCNATDAGERKLLMRLSDGRVATWREERLGGNRRMAGARPMVLEASVSPPPA